MIEPLDPPVVDKPVPVMGRCPECGAEVFLFVSTWESFWGVRVRPHSDREGGRPCRGGGATLRKGRVR